MKPQSAYGEIALEFGGNTVFLRPSLRAAIHLERLHDGLPNLLRKIEEFDTLTVWHIITATAGKDATDDLFAYAANQPLAAFARAAQAPLFELVAALLPEPRTSDTEPQTTAEPTPWAEIFQQLYGYATGWMSWPPEAAWNATPQEIADAFEAHINHLKSIHGAPEDNATGQTDEQRQENIDLGLDPEFDRAGLAALKGLSTRREGQAA